MYYVTSDLHGYPLDKFKALLKKSGFSDDDFMFVLGDVIDRGDEGVKTLLWMMEQPNIELVLGNHEAALLSCRFLFDTITEDSIASLTAEQLETYAEWKENGAEPTLKDMRALDSYTREDIFDYLSDAPLYETVSASGKEFILVHGGLGGFSENKDISEYTPEELLWTRPALCDRYYEDVFTVFGHTPTAYMSRNFKGRAIKTDTWINIDTGSAMGLAPMILRLDDMKEFYAD